MGRLEHLGLYLRGHIPGELTARSRIEGEDEPRIAGAFRRRGELGEKCLYILLARCRGFAAAGACGLPFAVGPEQLFHADQYSGNGGATPLSARPQPRLRDCLVRTERLELSHLSIPEPKSGASANSATSANAGAVPVADSPRQVILRAVASSRSLPCLTSPLASKAASPP